MHLNDSAVTDSCKFVESDFFTGGDMFTIFDTEYWKFGIGIWYDVNFPDYSHILWREFGADFLVFPSAYSQTSGEYGLWDAVRRGRALDEQVYLAMVSPARPKEDKEKYQSYGYSSVVNPWGQVIADSDEKEALVLWDINMNLVHDSREQMPCYKQRRHDLYSKIHLVNNETKD